MKQNVIRVTEDAVSAFYEEIWLLCYIVGSQAKLLLEQLGLPEFLGRILHQNTINVVLSWLRFLIAVVLGL